MVKMILLFILFTLPVFGQSTIVSATITDLDGTTWSNCTYTVQFSPTVQGYAWSGGNLLSNSYFTGSCDDGTGTFSLSLPSNTSIYPIGSSWRFTICPNASAPCQSTNIPISGATINLTTQLSELAGNPRFPASPTAYGYADIEVSPNPLPGGGYFNVTTSSGRVWNGRTWQSSGGGGSGTVSGQIANTLPVASGANALTGPSHLSESGGQDIFSQPVSAPNYITSGTTQGYQQYAVGTGSISLPAGSPASYFGWIGPQSGTPAYFLSGPVSSPTSAGTGEFLVCPNPTLVNGVNQSQCVWVDAANLPLLNASNTFSGTTQNIASTNGCWAINNDTFLCRNTSGQLESSTSGTTPNDAGSFIATDIAALFRTQAVYLQHAGTKFSTSAGCSESGTVGAATAGKMTIGTAAACSTVITMGGGASATNGWHCSGLDETSKAQVPIVGTSTTTVTLSGTFAVNDVVSWECNAY